MKKLTIILLTVSFSIPALAQTINVDKIDKIQGKTSYSSFEFLNSVDQSTSNDRMKMEEATVASTNDGKDVEVKYEETLWEKAFPEENEIIKQCVEYEFDIQGLSHNHNNPELLVQYHIYHPKYAKKKSYYTDPDKNKYMYFYLKAEDLISKMDDGTVIVSMIDTNKDETVWEGFAYNSFDRNASYEKRRQQIRQAIDGLMKQFAIDNRKQPSVVVAH